MLTASFGAWENGAEVPSKWQKSKSPYRDQERIASHPEGAPFTRYGIEVSEKRSTNAGWELGGGLVGLAVIDGQRVELFGKEVLRVHGPAWTFRYGRDFSYEFFLVVRPRSAGVGRVVTQWMFSPEELALTGSPIEPGLLRRSTRSEADIETIVHPVEGALQRHYVDAYLDFDSTTKLATVTITGLKRPFEERVDLTAELAPIRK
jgi:hypothetical protein